MVGVKIPIQIGGGWVGEETVHEGIKGWGKAGEVVEISFSAWNVIFSALFIRREGL